LGFSIYAHFDGSRFIVSWHGARHRGTPGGPYTFQVILYPNGLMVYQYLSMTPTISEATVGMQNAARNDGLTVVHNSSYVRNALAVVIAPPLPFLSVQPPSGVVPPGGSLDLRLELKTFGLVPGIYRDTVRISSNDPDESMFSVPVVLNAGSQPDIAAIPSEVAFGTVYVGQSGDRTLQVRNAGLGVLEFTGASVTGSGFSLASAVVPALLGPGESVPLAVRFAPASACAPCIGALELQSNDQDENPLTVPLSGTGLPPPDIAVSLDTLRAAGATTLGPLAQQRTKPLLVSNSGASDLRFSVPVSGDSSAALVPASPRWISADPASATIPAGSSMALDVVFNAADLPDGDHAGNLVISSNDPDEPAVEVPCRFHVGVVGATFELDPNSLMPRSQGRWVSTDLELGSGHDPHAIVLSTLRLQRAVPVATDGPISYHDDDQDGLPQARYKFDRASLHDLLAEGDQVPVEVIGEVENVTWFQGIDMVRSLPPDVPDPPAYAGVYSSGSRVTITWNDPPGSSTSGHDLWISFDDGATWGLVAASLTGSSYQWTVPNQVTDQGLLELVSWDARGARGSWLSRRFRIVAGTAAVGDRVPGEFGLRLAGTSPGRGSAGLELAIPTRSAVELRIFDVHGRFVSELAQREFDPGWHRLAWNGTVSSGAPAPAGVYFVRLIAGGRTFRVRIALLR
jgi:hypothetical protein